MFSASGDWSPKYCWGKQFQDDQDVWDGEVRSSSKPCNICYVEGEHPLHKGDSFCPQLSVDCYREASKQRRKSWAPAALPCYQLKHSELPSLPLPHTKAALKHVVEPTWKSWSFLNLIEQSASRSWLGLIAVILPGNESPSILQTMCECTLAQRLQQLVQVLVKGCSEEGRVWAGQDAGSNLICLPKPTMFCFQQLLGYFEGIVLTKCFGLWNRCRIFSPLPWPEIIPEI